MVKKLASSNSVKSLDNDITLNTSGQYKLKNENYYDECEYRVCSDKLTDDAGLSSEAVINRQRVTDCHQKQHHSDVRSVNSVAQVQYNHIDVTSGSVDVHQPLDQSSMTENIISFGNVFCCSKCGRRFTRLHCFMKHKKLNCSVYCSTCREPFADLSALRSHRITHHVSLTNRKNTTQMSLPRPQKPVQCICNYCGRTFKKMTTLNSHVMTHTGERCLLS